MKTLNLLILEDDEKDAVLALRELERHGYDVTWERVDTADAFRVGLANEQREAVISDYRVPGFDAPAALDVFKEIGRDIPFLVISGSVGEDVAVQLLKQGAHDCVIKDHLYRLGPAMERELRDAATRREHALVGKELEETHRELANHVRELEAKNAELERFVYTVSHDLKSPLITVKGFTEELRKDLESKNSDRIATDLELISTAADQMGTLLDELLELSRIGRTVNPPEEVSLKEVIDEALGNVAGLISQQTISVSVPKEFPVIHGDRVRLVEVFQNLIENAVKFLGEQSEPLVEIVLRQDGDQQVCVVRDNGVGIDPRYHEKVFNLFERLNEDSSGSGVGLSVVQRILEVHGQRIWVESAGVGCGTSFCFTLPQECDAVVEA